MREYLVYQTNARPLVVIAETPELAAAEYRKKRETDLKKSVIVQTQGGRFGEWTVSPNGKKRATRD